MTEPNQYTEPYERALPEEEDETNYGEPFSKEMKQIRAHWREAKPYWEKRYKVSRRDKQYAQSKQWDDDVEEERFKNGLATITIPLIRGYYNKQLGNALPGSVDFMLVDTDPVPNTENDDKDDAEAKTLSGVLRFIDKQSRADIHRGKARKDQFSGGIGWLGLDYVYSDSPMQGQLKIYSPKFFDQVYIHPHFNEPDASDAEYSFHETKMPYETAKGIYGDKIKRIKEKGAPDDFHTFADFDDCLDKISTLDCCETKDWIDEKGKTVTIATHHWRRHGTRVFYKTGTRQYTEEHWNRLKEEIPDLEEKVLTEPVEKIEKKGWYVEQRIVCGWSVLEKTEFFINRIPWTPIFGYTLEDGKEYTYHSIIHDAVEAQSYANWLYSQHATKSSEAGTIALVGNGLLNDGQLNEVAKVGNIKIYGVDHDQDGTGAQAAQVISNPDNGSIELQQLTLTIELMREMMNTDNDSKQNQVINSAKQLGLHIQDRDSVREELDVNYRLGLESHYSKLVEGIKAVYGAQDIVQIVDLDQGVERVGAQIITNEISTNYSVTIKMSPSGTAQKQQAQQLASTLITSQDPSNQAMGLTMSIDNSDLKNKRQLLKMVYKDMFTRGQIAGIPNDVIKEIIQEQQESGQIQQMLSQMAEPMAQKRLQEMLQDKSIQAQLAQYSTIIQKSQSDTQRAQLLVQKADVDAQSSVRKDELQVLQEIEQTKQDQFQSYQEQEQTRQDQLQTLREFFQVQQEIAQSKAKGIAVSAELIQKIASIKIPQNF